jgi:MEDS: MEthanogen/methylotroph, DcmR Sensory domain
MAQVRKGVGVVHSVHFYDTDRALIQRLQSIFMSAFESGNSVVLVASEEHYRQLSSALKRQVVDIAGLQAGGRLIFFEASEALEHFMVNGMPNRELFYKSIGRLLREAKDAASNAESGLTVFGEMVAVLWDQGNREGALALETLWNELLSESAFHLHCAYPRSLFADGDQTNHIEAICQGHSHVVGYAA